MANYYLQTGNDTSLVYYLDVVSNINVGLPSLDYKLDDVMGEGAQLQGIGNQRGRVFSFSYIFDNNYEYEREQFLDAFVFRPDIVTYLYKQVQKRVSCVLINTGSTVVVTGIYSTNQLNQLSTGDVVTGVGISSTTTVIIDSIASTYFVLSVAATASIANAEVIVKTFLGRTRVYGQPLGGESYDNINVSKEVAFQLLAPDPFFTSTNITDVGFTSTGLAEKTTSLTISGYRTPCLFTCYPSTSFSVFQVKRSDRYGFQAVSNFSPSQAVQVDCRGSDLACTVNGLSRVGVFSVDSTPFMMERGLNTFSIVACNSTGSSGVTISYYEREL